MYAFVCSDTDNEIFVGGVGWRSLNFYEGVLVEKLTMDIDGKNIDGLILMDI